MLKKSEITPDAVARALTRAGLSVFTNNARNFNLNLVGIRSDNRKADGFDDWFTCFWVTPDGNWMSYVWAWTTDPGRYFLTKKLLNPKGCAILAPGQYHGAYKIGYHRGQYKALVQRGAAVNVYRDKDRDMMLDASGPIHRGFYGINIHRPSKNVSVNAARVGRTSAGCQVSQRGADHVQLMQLAEKAEAAFGNSFTYTLITEATFRAGQSLS